MTSVVDNLGDNTLQNRLQALGQGAVAWDMATAFLSLEGLRLLSGALDSAQGLRLLFGEDADRLTRLEILRRMRERSEAAFRDARIEDPTLTGLRGFARLMAEGKVQARVYRKNPHNPDAKGAFHAKVYVAHHPGPEPYKAVAGSGNLSRNGLTRNIELGLKASDDQAGQLAAWFQARWDEAVEDDVTEDLHRELLRHLDLYPPRAIFLRALLEWGVWVQGREMPTDNTIVPLLDPHQKDGFGRAMRVLERERGVMVCDGVGLGKSYIALALMDEYLRRGRPVLLIAPRAILDASWHGYLRRHFARHTAGFNLLVTKAITDFQDFPARAEGKKEAEIVERMARRGKVQEREDFLEDLKILGEHAHLVVIDESHNLRTPSASRTLNALAMLSAADPEARRVALLTATPLNTKHTDLTTQFALAKGGPDGRVGGRPLAELRPIATRLDGEMRRNPDVTPDLFAEREPAEPLIDALGRLAIQRSRATCRRIAKEQDKPLWFPERRDVEVVKYALSPTYASLVEQVERDFLKLARFLEAYRAEVKEAAKSGRTKIDRRKVQLPSQGMRLSAYLIDRYRKASEGGDSLREAQVESFLASLVFKNVMKQMESSAVAFQSILQSLGAGLAARLLVAFADDDAARVTAARHEGWINRRVRTFGVESAFDDDPEEDDADPMGDEPGGKDDDEGPNADDVLLEAALADRIARAKRSPAVRRSLADFTDATHDRALWRKHLEGDLEILATLADLTHAARASGRDAKLDRMATAIRGLREEGRKVLVFTQSVRTAEYLQDNLPRLIGGERVERVDANVAGDRRTRILHDFSPEYNAPPRGTESLFGREPLDVLVATDVLSEGVNLQEAGAIVNYDLHWNPVRLIQRIGRVDRRLRSKEEMHDFRILNVFPPPEVERILNLERAVAGRVGAISEVLGIDQAFFRSTDPEGTLKEFGEMVDGEIGADDGLLLRFNALREPTGEEATVAHRVPDGAFGVWRGSGTTGGFALFRLVLAEGAPEADREAFGRMVGQPAVALLRQGERPETDPVRALTWLEHVPEGTKSADPSEEGALKTLLKSLEDTARQSLGVVGATRSLRPQLVVWMELQP